MPAHNHALRRKEQSGVLELPIDPGPPSYVPAASVDPAELGGCFGPFSSKRAARETLRTLAAENALCWKVLGFEKRKGACFARQLKRCAGACVGTESLEEHHARLARALRPLAIPPWPFPGLAAIREHSVLSDRTDVHVVRDWCWLGTAREEGEYGRLIETPPRPVFDADIARILIGTLRRRKCGVLAIPSEGHQRLRGDACRLTRS
jgi:DNA polymerase-3 subunit epsilon